MQFKLYLECPFCGTIVGISDIEEQAVNTAEFHYKYIQNNGNRIAQSPFVKFSDNNGNYTIVSNFFHADDGNYNKIESPSLQLRYSNNGSTEVITLGVIGKSPIERLVIKINDLIISPPIYGQEKYTTWVSLSADVLLAICQTRSFDIETNQHVPATARFADFPIFASRFYNAVFDRMKFLYSTQVKLLSDKF